MTFYNAPSVRLYSLRRQALTIYTSSDGNAMALPRTMCINQRHFEGPDWALSLFVFLFYDEMRSHPPLPPVISKTKGWTPSRTRD